MVTANKANGNSLKSTRHSMIFQIPENDKFTINGFMERWPQSRPTASLRTFTNSDLNKSHMKKIFSSLC
jgi:hypothetical protein